MQTHTLLMNVGPVIFDLTLLVMSLLTVLVVFSLVFWASRDMKLEPTGVQNILEYIYDFVMKLLRENLGDKAERYSLYAFSLFSFLLVANNLGLVTKLETLSGESLWMSPTSNLIFSLGLSLIVSIFNNVQGIRVRSLPGYLKEFLKPVPLMLPMNILEEITNFLSLGLRLFGNIFAGEVLVDLLAQLAHSSVFAFPIAFVCNVIWTMFSIFISCLQAYVFVLLSLTYLGKKVND